MKAPILLTLSLLAFALPAFAVPPDDAPMISKEVKRLEERIHKDTAAGALTTPDADELNREVEHVKGLVAKEPSLTPATRRDLREKLGRIRNSLDLKEMQAKALPSSSPSAAP